jgi:cyclophilin family peptidyl-prolyl cis-trans isomerase
MVESRPPRMSSASSSSPYRAILLLVVNCILACPVWAAPPSAPTNPVVTVLGVQAMVLTWTDTSNNETGFEVQYSFTNNNSFTTLNYNGASDPYFPANSTSASIFFTETASQRIYLRVRARNADGNSNQTANNISGITPSIITFNAPSSFTATAPNDGTTRLTWVDNSNSENEFELEMRETPSGSFTVLGTLNLNTTTIDLTGFLAPTKTYEFRLRARKGNSPSYIYSGYSNLAPITAPALTAPTSLVATPTGERTVNLTWVDNSTNEQGYEVQARIAGAANTYVTLFYTAANATSAAITSTALPYPGIAYEFRVLGAYQYSPTVIISSAPSNTATATTFFNVPTAVTAVAPDETTINVTWTDNSAQETGYLVLARLQGTTQFEAIASVAANATSSSVSGFSPGVAYEIAVQAYFLISANDSIDSAISTIVPVTTKDGFTSRSYEPITLNQPFTYQATTTTKSPRVSWDVTGLPGGLNFNSTTGVISGTPNISAGVFVCGLQATFQDGWITNKTLTLRIIRTPGVPVIESPISNVSVNLGATGTGVILGFSDPDTRSDSAVRVSTSLGNMDIILYNTATPQTVANFLGYVGRDDYDGSVFHRSVSGFVLQGGAFKPASAPNNFSVTPTVASPPNEPGIANLRGTVAMAKLGGNPNSATNQFFVNLNNNNSPTDPNSLDNQNGGFTVFGRVAGNGMAVADAIAALPRGNYAVNLGSNASTLDDFPINSSTAPNSIDLTKVVLINSVESIHTLSYSITQNSNPSVVSATLSGGTMPLQALSPGVSTITVTATDLDGNSVSQTFTVTVNDTFSQWASTQGLPVGQTGLEDNPDFDQLNNLQEFAFMGAAGVAGPVEVLPYADLQDNAGVKKAGITFNARKFVPGLVFTVRACDDLGTWQSIWTSTSGFTGANVSAQDMGTHYEVTVTDSAVELTPGTRRFLHAVVSYQEP